MVYDYTENNTISNTAGTWASLLGRILDVIPNLILSLPATIIQFSAISLPYPDNYFDAVITDPPYYDNVPYSYLSDFFYVWLKRTLGDIYPELFLTPLTPKSEEIVAYSHTKGGYEAGKRAFEAKLTKVFQEIHRVLKPNGIAVIIYAHKSLEAWDTIINALLKAGLTMTSSWPVKMEMEARLRRRASAALLSSILMVCRKQRKTEEGEYPDVLREIEKRVSERLERFWLEGLRGADYFMSAIGPAVEVFGRYERVVKATGEEAKVEELLKEVRRIVAEDALKRILESPDLSGVDAPSRFYLLWRWTFESDMRKGEALGTEGTETEISSGKSSRTPKVPYDDARILAQAVVGAEAETRRDWEHWGFVQMARETKGAVVRVLPADERPMEDFRRERFETMVDALHYALKLWEQRRYDALQEHLSRTYGENETFWRFAQALSDILPEGDRERRLVQGLMAWRGTAPSKGKPKQIEIPLGR